MLHELHIRQLGVIEDSTAVFDAGLTVLTGETGAGKTMVVSSLRLLSGHRAGSSRVRTGAPQALVEGIFSIDAAAERITELLDGVGAVVEDGEIIASRTVTAAGRSRAHLGGRAVAAGVLGEFAAEVLTIHGQNDQLRLLDPARQRDVLDDYAGTGGLLALYRKRRAEWKDLSADLRQRIEKKRELALEAETLHRAVEMIDAVDPQPGEDQQLKAQIQRMQAADELRENLRIALAALDGSSDDAQEGMQAATAVDAVARAEAALRGKDAELDALAERLAEISTLLTDIAMEAGSVLANVADPDELEGMLQRQQQLRELRKFAADVDGVIAWRDDARQRLSSIDVSEEATDALRQRVEAAKAAVVATGRELSTQRSRAAQCLGKTVTQEIQGLQMLASIRVKVTVDDAAEEPGPWGLDEVEFELVQGGRAQPLASHASGGELSRVMLALEVVLAGAGRTMVFDEVDAGVGGTAAVEIAKRLARLAVDNQVIVVTHLPQVAAFADAHVFVSKTATDTSVSSTVHRLDDEHRVEELSRMLAGLDSDTGRAHAEELLVMARKYKATLSK